MLFAQKICGSCLSHKIKRKPFFQNYNSLSINSFVACSLSWPNQGGWLTKYPIKMTVLLYPLPQIDGSFLKKTM